MMLPPVAELTLLLVWGAVVALDLVSVPQALLARPVVAGGVAGLILGDPEAGLRLGVMLELFALDVLPIGAARYPDYGPATIAAVAAAAGRPWQTGLGVATLVGLVVAIVGGWSLQFVRRRNAQAVQRQALALAAGDAAAIRALHYGGLARDTLRGVLLTGGGLILAALVNRLPPPDTAMAIGMTLVAIGTALAAAIGGAFRSGGRGARLAWLIAGAVVGSLVAVFR